MIGTPPLNFFVIKFPLLNSLVTKAGNEKDENFWVKEMKNKTRLKKYKLNKKCRPEE